MSSRILVVDDDADWIDTYKQWLEPEGYEVQGAQSASEALRLAGGWHPHVILVDQKLEGPGGRDLGLSLIVQLAACTPPSRLILVTGFATREAVLKAFRNGASDYLQKNDILEPLLLIKVREAVAVASRAMGDLHAEAELQRAWTAAQTETNPQAKGRQLEETLRRLFETIPGFRHARTNVQNPTEEIDVFVTNCSTDPLLSRQGDFIVVECKNWSSTVGTSITARLRDKVDKRFGRSKLGICVALGGFAQTVQEDLRAERRGDLLILLFDRANIQEWIDAPNRAAWLVTHIERAAIG